MGDAEKSLRNARIMHLVFVLAAFSHLLVPLKFVTGNSQAPSNAIVAAFGFVAATNLGLAIFFRSRQVSSASEALKRNAEDAAALQQWRKGVLLSFVFCESIILFGLALRFTLVPWKVCGIFYAVGVLFLLAWAPKLELPPE